MRQLILHYLTGYHTAATVFKDIVNTGNFQSFLMTSSLLQLRNSLNPSRLLCGK